MNDISFYILDIASNSVNALSKNIIIKENINTNDKILTFSIIDDGIGMDFNELSNITNPFYTTRNKNVGFGIPLFKELVKMSNGKLIIESSKNKGTNITSIFDLNSLNTLPIGNMGEVIYSLILNDKGVDIKYRYEVDSKYFEFDMNEFTDISLDNPSENYWIINYINENIKKINNILEDL